MSSNPIQSSVTVLPGELDVLICLERITPFCRVLPGECRV